MTMSANTRPLQSVRRSPQQSKERPAPDKIHLYLKHFPAAGLPLRVGTNKAVHGLAAGLVAAGIPVEIWCEGDADSEVTTLQGYRIRCFGTRAAYRTLRLAPSLKAHLQTLT